MAASVIRISTDASRNITGLTGGSDGRILYLHNVGSFDVVLKDESASSSAANRFALTGDVTLTPDALAIIQYDSTSSRWRCLNSGSGGGSTLPVADTQTIIKGSADATKLLRFEVDGLTTGTTRVLTPQDADYTIENTVHASKHVSGGSDSIKLDDLAAPDDNTDLNATTTAHGLMPKGTGSTTTFYRSDMTQATPAAVLADADYGDVTVSSSGTVITIDNDAVTYAKIQNVSATDKLLGRSTAGAGDVEEIACTAAGRALLDDATAGDQRTTLGVGTGDSPQFASIELGHASDCTLQRISAGDIEIETNLIYRANGTDIPIGDGGTGASTAYTAKDALTVKGADVASATTTDLAAATGEYVDVTGTTTITGLGTLAAGAERVVRFTGILTLTHHATALILPGGANITTAANDRAFFRSLGSGNWICTAYTRASGEALILDGDLLAIAALSPANDDVIQRKAGVWTNRTIAQLSTDLGIVAASETAAGIAEHATSTEVQTGTDVGRVVSPATLKSSLSVAKGWANFTMVGAGGTINQSVNVSSLTDSGVGNYRVVWNGDFNDAYQCTLASAALSGTITFSNIGAASVQTAGQSAIVCANTAGTLVDADIACVGAFGAWI